MVRERGSLVEWIYVAGGRGEDTNSLECIACSLLSMVVFTLCIHGYNVIDVIVQRIF